MLVSCRGHVVALLTLKANWFGTITVKQWEIMIQNAVLLLSANNEETPYEQLRYITGLAVREHVVVQLYFWVHFYICTSVIVSNLLSYITKPKIKGKIKLNSHQLIIVFIGIENKQKNSCKRAPTVGFTTLRLQQLQAICSSRFRNGTQDLQVVIDVAYECRVDALQASCRLLLPQAGRLKECLSAQMLHSKKKHNSRVIVRHVHKNNIKIKLQLIFFFPLIVIFPLFLGMVMYANKFKTKEK